MFSRSKARLMSSKDASEETPRIFLARSSREAGGVGGVTDWLEVVEGTGHLLFWERPEEFAALVEGFLG